MDAWGRCPLRNALIWIWRGIGLSVWHRRSDERNRAHDEVEGFVAYRAGDLEPAVRCGRHHIIAGMLDAVVAACLVSGKEQAAFSRGPEVGDVQKAVKGGTKAKTQDVS